MRKSEKEALQAMLDDEQETIKALEKAYQRAIRRIDNHIRILESDEMTQSKIYQKRYQEAMKAQINAALDELHKKSNQTIEEYLTRSYQHGYVGTMYSLHKQGMPILAPIDQRAVTRAVRTDSKLSGRLYGELGVDMQKLKKTIRREISIGISIGSDYNMIARQVQISSGIPLKRAKTIVRTEGHRIQQQSADDARNAAKAQGCQVVKQWDAVLDGNTRTDHRILDGQIREVGEPFEIDGKKAEYPGAFGRPEEDCNCRCVALTRAKWALDADELQTMKDRAKFFGLDKAERFREFEEKYLKAERKQKLYNELSTYALMADANGRFVNNTEKLYRYAAKIKPIEGFEDFTCHADPDNFFIDLTGKGNEEDYLLMSPEEYAKHIKESSVYKGGNVRIISCRAGAKADGAAQRLADALERNVYAPTETVHVDENGEMFLADSDILAEMWYYSSDKETFKQHGQWLLFKPRKE
mgnify:CR=1 FL=1